MTRKSLCFVSALVAGAVGLAFCLAPVAVQAAEPIKLGAPLSTAFVYGWVAERGIKLAVEEINAAGGVNVGGEKRPFSVDVIDTRDLEPGVPVDDAIKAVEKLYLGGLMATHDANEGLAAFLERRKPVWKDR